LIKGGIAGIQLPPMQGAGKGGNMGGGAESMYDATGQLKIKTLNQGGATGFGGNSKISLVLNVNREKPFPAETWYSRRRRLS
jgi:hypothetical protein